MGEQDKVNILLVDDQPAKLLSLDVILQPLNENILRASSADEALRHLLQSDVAVVLLDVCMPSMDGFELAEMIREHPRFGRTAIIFISAVHLTDADRLRGYGLGAVDYIPVPIIPEVLRAKVAVFAELYRKTAQLNHVNQELERRVAERTAELETSNRLLRESREQVALELAATQRLQETSTRLILQDDEAALYDQVLDAAMAIMRSDFASLQIFHPERGEGGELRLLTHRGFTPEAAEHWAWVGPSMTGACGRSLGSIERTVIADVTESEPLRGTTDLEMYARCGIRSCQSTPLVSRAGKLLGMMSTHWREPHTPSPRELGLLDVLARQAADIIERVKSAQALRESESRFRMLADNMAQLAWMADGDGSVFWLNRRWHEYTGLSPEQSTGSGWTAALHPCEAFRITTYVEECFRTGRAWEDTFRTRGADGGYRWFLTRAFPITDEGGQVIRWFGTGTDVTEQREAQQVLTRDRETLEQLVEERTSELKQSNERLRLSERMATIGTLAAGLGHDIGNLLLPVRLRLDALETSPLTESAREDVAAIRKAAEYLQRLSGSLRLLALDSSGEDHGESRTEIEPWWRESEGMMRNGIPQPVELTSQIAPGLPPVRVGKAGLTQVVFNLVQNAGDILEGRTDGRIAVSAQPGAGGRTVVISVTDNGPGMTEEAKRRCLEPFFTTKARELSTGLGLPLVGAIVARAHGTLQVTSSPGAGASFRIEFPAAPVEQAREASRVRVAAVTVADARLRAHVVASLIPLGFIAATDHTPEVEVWVCDASDPSTLARLKAAAIANPDLRTVLLWTTPERVSEIPGAIRIDPRARVSEVRARLTDALTGLGEPLLERA